MYTRMKQLNDNNYIEIGEMLSVNNYARTFWTKQLQ